MKFIRFGERYNCNDGYLEDISMIFRESLSREDLKEPMIYEFHGNYVRLTPLKNNLLSYGTVFDEPEDDNIFLDRKILIELLDKLEELTKQKFRVIYLLKENEKLEFTSKFPTKYALYIKEDANYKLIESNDTDLKLLAKFLSYYKKSKNYETFFNTKTFKIEKINWDIRGLELKWLGNEIVFFNEKNNKMKIKIEDLIMIMNQWLNFLDEKPEKIYLLLENGEYRLTTQYSP